MDLDELQTHIDDGYDHLEPGDEGFWPFIGFWVDDFSVGDRLRFDDGFTCVVRSVETDVTRRRVVPVEGEPFTIGRMARGFKIDRWGTHSQLSTISVR